MGNCLWYAVRCIEAGILRAWGPTGSIDSWRYDGKAMDAADNIAKGVAIVIRCILEGIVLYLTARGVAKLPQLLAELRKSKFGESFAVWVEANYQHMLKNPKLNKRVGKGVAAQAVEIQACR